MAKESNKAIEELATDRVVNHEDTGTTELVLEESKTQNLILKRKLVGSSNGKGKTFWVYYMPGILRGKDIEISFIPPKDGLNLDVGGFKNLELAFGDETQADFVVMTNKYTNKDNKKTESKTYKVVYDNKDTNEYFEAPVVPSRPSDKALLANLLIALERGAKVQ